MTADIDLLNQDSISEFMHPMKVNQFYTCIKTLRKDALELISETGLSAAKPAPTPMDTTTKLTTSEYDQHIKETDQDCDVLTGQGAYQRLVGKLLYLTVTRPDIAYSVQTLSQFLQKPKKSHMNANLRIVKYIKGKLGQGLLLSNNKKDVLIVHCDADWLLVHSLGNLSQGTLSIKLGDLVISWKSKKQTIVSRSLAESE
ncbi:secreted RxLR effector protein 161-like [Capsicum annuum]|uniref:secreted RxLR effector protein 161-like n=1 Tax=Capsicum annuum TaxID=4072 RepID=UPI001FB0DF3B|nr:secreted RxLR effector protein 161-like [Capsicum annuum]